MLDRIKALWVTEPVAVTTTVAAIVVFVAAKLGILIDQQNVGEALGLILPILLGGAAARQKVSPAPATTGPDSDALLGDDAIKHIDAV
jgi:hypothetical protein